MITLELTTAEAQAVADALRELVERTERDELILGPIDWDDLRTANNKLIKAIDDQKA
jgi:alkanesulfonate monooxygenase SsuD/methylene tetrahydromethanopterin reductase-like flavin-dependent oxidoreductase (luciferase family)